MFTINGTDYTLYVIVAVSVIVLFTLQSVLCRRAKRMFLKLLPLGYVALTLVLAVACLFGDTGGFIDLRDAFALILCGYAAICAAAIGLAWLVCRMKSK